ESSAIGMTITSIDARFVRVNAAFAHMIGRTPEAVAGMAVHEVTHADDLEADRRLVGELVADPSRIVQREKRYLRPDGTEVVALLSVSAVADADGVAQYFIAQMVDVTQQRVAERALARSERRFRTPAPSPPPGPLPPPPSGAP